VTEGARDTVTVDAIGVERIAVPVVFAGFVVGTVAVRATLVGGPVWGGRLVDAVSEGPGVAITEAPAWVLREFTRA
jgi:hypothetical protein